MQESPPDDEHDDEVPISRDQQLDYLRWTCTALQSCLAAEEARIDATRNVGHATFLIVPVLAGLALQSAVLDSEDSLLRLLRLLVILGASMTLLCWYKVMKVNHSIPALTGRVFTDDDNTSSEVDWVARMNRARDYLLRSLELARAEAAKVVLWRGRLLLAAVVTIALLGLAYTKGIVW